MLLISSPYPCCHPRIALLKFRIIKTTGKASGFDLGTLVAVKMNIDFICFGEACRFVAVDALCFRMEKKFSAITLSYGFPRPVIESVMPYCWVSLKYAWDVYWKPWSLWNCNSAATFFFSLRAALADSVQHPVHRLPCRSLVGHNTVVVQIADHGRIQYTLFGL